MFQNRRFVLVAVILGVICLGLIGFFVWSRFFGVGQSAEIGQPIELWDAYERARAAAQAVAEDAELISASADWQVADQRAVLSGVPRWAFVFYSPGTRNVLDVGANAEEAWVALETRIWNTPNTLEEGDWRAGPQDALLVFLAYAGDDFLEENSRPTVDVHLSAAADGTPMWSITALAPSTRDMISLVLDAETLQILSASP